jgi:hypothetical protein
MMDEHRKEAGFADEQLLAPSAIIFQPCAAVLVGVEFPGGAFVEGFAHEAGRILKAEPSLVFERQGA